MGPTQDSFTFTVGKLDAGMAILIGERAHLIEFPSLLLPPGVTSGSIVNIAVHRNIAEEKRQRGEFWELQDEIMNTFGVRTPEAPKLQLRNVTQTSVTLEWPALNLATAKLRSLDIYRNGQRLAAIPSPLTNTTSKLSGLEMQKEYTFQLILRTTAGTYPSNVLKVVTHTINDTSGISVCFGNVEDPQLLEDAKLALEEMGAKWSDKIQIDTTHFVCTTPAATPAGSQPSGSRSDAPGVEYQRALQLTIPVVQPQWVLACHASKKMVPIAGFYLGSNPSAPLSSKPFARPQSMAASSSQQNLPNSPTRHRQSLPSPTRDRNAVPTSAFINQMPDQEQAPSPETLARAGSPPSPEDHDADHVQPIARTPHKRSGTMTKDFKFPPKSPSDEKPPPVPALPGKGASEPSSTTGGSIDRDRGTPTPTIVLHEPEVEKPKEPPVLDVDEEVGETVEIAL